MAQRGSIGRVSGMNKRPELGGFGASMNVYVWVTLECASFYKGEWCGVIRLMNLSPST